MVTSLADSSLLKWVDKFPLVMAAAFLPAAGLMPLEQFYHGWTFVIAGIAFLLCGVIDRWILAHNLASLQVQEEQV